MSAAVLAFPSQREGLEKIPTPVYYRLGDEYVRVNITGDAAADVGLYPGAVAIFLRHFHQNGALHLITLDGEMCITRLESYGRFVRFGHDLTRAAIRPATGLDIFGALAELYPTGLGGSRSIVYQPDRARLSAPLHPERGMAYPLLAATN